MSTRLACGVLAAAAIGLSASFASASLSNVPVLSVSSAPVGGGQSDSWASQTLGSSLTFNTAGTASWVPSWQSTNSVGGAFTLWNDNPSVGRVTGASFVNDPVSNIVFAVQNNTALTQEFTVTIPVLNFTQDLYYISSASAQVGVTDANGNGATITGSFAGGKSFQYSVFGPGATSGLLTAGTTVGISQSGNNSENFTDGINSYLIDGQTLTFKFTLTPGDIATGSGTIVTTLVPAPGSLALMGLGGIVAIRRRR